LDWFKRIGDSVVDLLFPPRCVACLHLGAWLCAGCQAKIDVISPPVCPRCGLPRGERASGACAACRRAPLQLDGLRSFAYHSEPLRQAIHEFKYEDLRSLAPILGSLMAEGWLRLAPAGWQADAIVPVPLHTARQRQRGYNQAELLAREMGARLGHPVVTDALLRVRATPPQVGLGWQERQANVHDAFRCRGDDLAGKHVLLVDDVCTTAATLESACIALRAVGVSSVLAYTLARARTSIKPLEGD
jgi:ComF family protein